MNVWTLQVNQGRHTPHSSLRENLNFHHCESHEIYFASGILIFGPQPLSASLNEELGFIYLLFIFRLSILM